MLVKPVIENGVGIIVIENPPVNALTPGVVSGIEASIDVFEASGEVRAIVLTAVGRTFVAGADIRRFQEMIEAGEWDQGAGLYELTSRIEGCRKPVVCALFGTTLGGGLELAMACHYRIASMESKIGQPEVKLGLIPGAGGTQRLPRLCGLTKAAEICALGNLLSVEEAQVLGIIDEITHEDLRTASIEFALRVSNQVPRRTCDLEDQLGYDAEVQAELRNIRRQSKERYQGATAGVLAVDAVEKAAELSFEDGLAIEHDLFVKALSSGDARTLIYLFFAEREAVKVPQVLPTDPFQTAEVIGFPKLYSEDVHLLEVVLRAEIPTKMVRESNALAGMLDFLCVRDVTDIQWFSEDLFDIAPVVVLTSENFSLKPFVEAGWDPGKLIGLRFWPDLGGFCEIGISAQTSAYVIHSLVRLLKQMGCPYVLEKPSPFYASSRIREHRFDDSDFKIEAWKLVNDDVLARTSDVDLIQFHCFGKPRHQCNVGLDPKIQS
ncbi:MAG: enoyl-CoA hydratase/isomerase family protein [Planctomycetota bacterium]|nr:enoyl-CoA hydratase/isomerase family protein [Planctomycetota bacterium]